MFGRWSLMDLARRSNSPDSRQESRRAYLDRQSPRFESLDFEELEDRLMLTMLGQQLFPADYPWNQNIANAPVAANSAAIISHIGSSIGVHPDWGEDSSTNGQSALYGIPYNVVHGNTTTKINVIIDNYPGESDVVPVPIPAGAVIEGDYQNGPNPNGGGYNSGQRGDSHLLIWDEDTDTAYELYGVTRPSDPTLFPNTNGVELPHTDGLWHAAQETVWHMSTDEFRALGDTSADAAGLSILAGLARPDEGLPTSQGGQGAIDHALRFTLPSGDVAPQYIYPASHVVNESSGATKLPLGARLRLANTPAIDSQISEMGPEAQIIATAMQQYGLVLADIGSPMYVTGTSASQTASNSIGLTWNMDDVLDLTALTAGDFQVVNLTPVVTGLSATSGSAGSTITINGQNFSGAAGNLSVFFGTAAATSVTYISDTQISATVPSGTGTVNVTVQSGVNETDPNSPQDNVNAPIFGYGTSAISSADQFSFGTAPNVTVGHSGITYTDGESAARLDSGLSVSSASNLSSVTVSITSNMQSGDTLAVVNANGLTVISGTGTVTLSGNAAASVFNTALDSITFANATNTTPAVRTLSIVATNVASQSSSPVTELITGVAPITVSAAYVSGSAWNSGILTYLAGHTNPVTSQPYGNATFGYALQTGSTAIETQTLPWTNLNKITVTFSGAVQDVGLGTLELVGGSGGSTPTVTGFTPDTGNTYTWTLSGPLTNNKYVFAIATTGSSFGTSGTSQVVDANGAGISGHFTEGQNFPSGTGLANSTFDFFFDVFPNDANRDGTDNTTDVADVRALSSNTRSTSTSYNPYYDLNGDGTINTTDLALVRTGTGRLATNSPTAPAVLVVAGPQFTALALGSLETGSSTSSTTPAISNVVPASNSSTSTTPAISNVVPASNSSTSTTPAVTTSVSGSSGSNSTGSTSSSGAHGRHSFAATERFAAADEAVSEFDLADFWELIGSDS